VLHTQAEEVVLLVFLIQAVVLGVLEVVAQEAWNTIIQAQMELLT
jgi:hypothetical protein